MKATAMATMFIGASLHVAIATAEVAVRHPTTSENEFQALAQALGYTPVSEILTEKKALTAETAELFRVRQFDAQAEWLRGGGATVAIDLLLALAQTADWPQPDRQVFATFYLRKAGILAAANKVEKLNSVFADLNAFLAHDENIDLGEMPMALKARWSEFATADFKKWSTFVSSPPTDVTSIVVNGRVVARQELLTFAFPRRSVRVTFNSNAYRPTTIRLTGSEVDWPILQRQAWIGEDCSLAPMDARWNESSMKALGFTPCDSSKPKSDSVSKISESKDRKAIEDFGLSQRPSDPFEARAPQGPSIVKNPWFWGALGAVAVGAVVAMQINGRQAQVSVQPTNRDAW